MNRWLRFFRRQAVEAEKREELDSYLDITAKEYMEGGMEAGAARAAAQKKLGNSTLILEEVYRMNSIDLIEGIVRDARQGLRMIRKQPGFSAAALFSLALGIGANTALFCVVNSVLIRPLPYPEAEELVGVTNTLVLQGQRFANVELSPGMYAALKADSRSFERFGVWTAGTSTVTGIGNPEQIVSISATEGVLPSLGVPAQIGRWFSGSDDTAGSPETVILSHGYWQRRFGGDRGILGRIIVVDFIPREVIGVMPSEFRFLDRSPDVLLTQRLSSRRADDFNYSGIARLKPGVTLALANQDTARVLQNWGEAEGVSKMLKELNVQPNLHPLKNDVVGEVGKTLTVLTFALGLVLLLVCANVTNLFLARAHARRQEFSIRVALGAGWGKIARELLVESLTLGLLGGVLGLLAAFAGIRLLVWLRPANLPRLMEISVDTSAFFVTLACSLILSLAIGLVAVLKCGRTGGIQKARGATQDAGQLRTQNGLVAVQIALAMVLLVASGLVVRTFVALRQVRPGFSHPERIQMVRISIPEGLVREPEGVIRIQADLQERFAAIAGVSAAGFASGLPLEWEYAIGMPIAVEGVADEDRMPPNRSVKRISPGLLAAQGTRLIAGRDFIWEDVSVKELWPLFQRIWLARIGVDLQMPWARGFEGECRGHGWKWWEL